MNAPIVLVDLDGTAANWRARYEDGMARIAPGVPLSPVEQFSVKDPDPSRNRLVREVLTEPGFYAQLEPYMGVRKALIEMGEDGIEVFILSTPFESNVTSASDKTAWVRRHLGRRFVDRCIYAHDKTVVRGDILIDDRPRHWGALEPTWQQVYFAQPYNSPENEGVAGVPRLTSWPEWRDVVLPLVGGDR
jgi:5'-nucleotidase